MISSENELPIVRQCKLVALAPSTYYYRPAPICEEDLQIMFRLDHLHLEMPFAGARMIRDTLRLEGYRIGRKHVTTLMRKMGLAGCGKRRGCRIYFAVIFRYNENSSSRYFV